LDVELTPDEWICICIARQVVDGEFLAQGLATPMVSAGYLLAWHTHAPNAYFASAIGQSVCREGAPIGLASIEALWLDKAMKSFGFVQAAADLLPSLRPKEFFRPGQIDVHGNFNNVAIGSDPRHPRLRLPGTGGIPDVTPVSSEIFLYVPRHSRATFVKKLDCCSGLGHHPARKQGKGARYLVTDLGQFDFKQGRMRLTHLHPGCTLQRVRAKTGFDFAVADPIGLTQAPGEQELRLLRETIDPFGIRKLELLSGPARRARLREIVALEKCSSEI